MKHGPSQHQRTAGVPSLYFDLLADFFNRIGQKPTLHSFNHVVGASDQQWW
jgi:hypothetical protein